MTLLPTASIPAEGKTKPVLSSEKFLSSIGAFVYDMTLVIAKDIYCCFTSLLIVWLGRLCICSIPIEYGKNSWPRIVLRKAVIAD